VIQKQDQVTKTMKSLDMNEKLCVTFTHLLVQKGIFLGLALHKNAWKIFGFSDPFGDADCAFEKASGSWITLESICYN
jgi:hypothetical protein